MNDYRSARSEWNRLDGLRSGMMSRLERLAQLTVPSVLQPDHYNVQQDQLTNGSNSLGAQAATHLVNKVMLATFAPSRPFMKLTMDEEEKQRIMQTLQVEEDVITDSLSYGERAAMNALEQTGERQQLFEINTHLVVVGNVLMDLSGDTINVVPIKDYVVRRNSKGVVVCIIIKESYVFEELDEEAQAAYLTRFPTTKDTDVVCLYTWIKYKGGKYYSTVWVEDVQLPKEYGGIWSPETLPYRALVWRLPAKQHYGIGRAEEFANDLAEHEGLSQALSEGAALATSFKWLANPGGITRPEDLVNSPNGGVIPGSKDDLALHYANIGQQLGTVQSIRQDVARRIGQGFLMNSAVTRDAERVTAEEIRIQVMELESSFGGAYSRLAVDQQKPLSYWLLKKANVEIKGTKIEPMVITGLDALSRSGDRDRMLTFLQDLSALDTLQPQTRLSLRETNVISDMAAGAGVERGRYVASPDEIAAKQAASQQQTLNEQAGAAAIDAAATNVTKEPPQ